LNYSCITLGEITLVLMGEFDYINLLWRIKRGSMGTFPSPHL